MIRGAAAKRYENGDLEQRVETLESAVVPPSVNYIWSTFAYTGYGIGVLSPIFIGGDVVVTNSVDINTATLYSIDEYDSAVVPSFEFVLTENGAELVALTITPGDWTNITGTPYAPGWAGLLTKTFSAVTLTPGNVYGIAYRGSVAAYNRLTGNLTFYTS